MAKAKPAAKKAAAPVVNPVRFYLLLLFVAVVGVGSYLLLKQQNDDFDAAQRLNQVNYR